jgi:replicative superfamily II helicase
VDFSKKLGKPQAKKTLDPREIYESLDRASDKGPLRPAQDHILRVWHEDRRGERDLIVKLQTGQGKTLIGLLMLQARLNEGHGPAVYLCANNFLADQTMQQAKEFGLSNICTEPDDSDFIAGRSILINNVNKLFNGRSRFGLGPESHSVGSLLLDDSHACADSIRSTFSISLKSNHSLYLALRELFEPDLESQGLGSFADIKLGKFDSILPVPYWAWRDRLGEVTKWMAKAADCDELRYSWPLLKDVLADCACVFSGTSLEIAPYLPNLALFGSYWKAKCRIFMSATITNDAFLVKGLDLSPEVIQNPLTYDGEKWYGEKMILIPSLIDQSLSRTAIIDFFAASSSKRRSGVVALVPGGRQAQDWKSKGATIVDRNSIISGVRRLKEKNFSETIVIANYYDGIDLPDDTCRVLILDSKPFSNGLIDSYSDSCRASSEVTSLKLARTIEQGLGRAVRGQKDYCVVLMIGANLVRAIRSGKSRLQFSAPTQEQVAIGLSVSEDAKDEVGEGVDPDSVLTTLIRQCLTRDEQWKAYYTQEMDKISVIASKPKLLDVFSAELKAERCYRDGDYEEARRITQDLVDKHYGQEDLEDRGWYLQEMARYVLPVSVTESNALQIKAHKKNKYLLKPKSGFTFEKLLIGEKRISSIKAWLSSFESNEAMILGGEEIISDLAFGVSAGDFEEALRKLGAALGFASQRPDKEWKEGPDNLWALREGEYLLLEAKNEVSADRKEIYKDETGQMNNACAWFKKNYPGAKVKNIMIIPTRIVGKAAGFNEPVQIMQKKHLKDLVTRFRQFLLEMKQVDLKDLDDKSLQAALEKHRLTRDDLVEKYSVDPMPPA